MPQTITPPAHTAVLDRAAEHRPHSAASSRPDPHQWGHWEPAEVGGEVFIENAARARRRSHVLRQLAEGRCRRLALFGPTR
ncbi:hypothetical protein [Kitasatospora sp. GP82]|uniref:hypothetical protein n=1 Tax=Kitasatospora sp. GP82 TaxID=3035089 RepID=UPI0024741AD9|nr:hypothetical protein [Kitasatospora sp. GP82]MDH6127960.1 hypothetical protein [Kitasatospora sp. GP82]